MSLFGLFSPWFRQKEDLNLLFLREVIEHEGRLHLQTSQRDAEKKFNFNFWSSELCHYAFVVIQMSRKLCRNMRLKLHEIEVQISLIEIYGKISENLACSDWCNFCPHIKLPCCPQQIPIIITVTHMKNLNTLNSPTSKKWIFH